MNRFEWLKGVLQARGMTDRAKALASAMAVQFANDDTRQINPSITTLAAYLGASKDTIKRAVSDLVDAGWLSRTEGRGAGNRTSYTLLSPGQVVPFKPQKKGADLHFQDKKKGAVLPAKGCKSAPSYNRDKQSFEQRARDRPAQHLRKCIKPGSDHEKSWNIWLASLGYPTLAQMGCRGSDATGVGWDAPFTSPPRSREGTEAMIAEKWARWAHCRTEERARA